MVLSLSISGLLGCSAESTNDVSSGPFRVRVAAPITHIVSPVDEAGYVDYLKAANIRHSKGVTAENNWEVVLQRVFGPLDELDPQSEQEYYRRLGIPKPNPEAGQGTYFQPLRLAGSDVSPLERKCADQFYEIEGPWNTEDYPELGQWMQMQSKHLDDLIAGSYRERNYVPYVMSAEAHAKMVGEIQRISGAGFMATLIGDIDAHPAPLSRLHANEPTHRSRELARVLIKRAYSRIGENDVTGACSDLCAIRRIGRLLTQGGLTEYLIGRAVDEMADHGYGALLESGKLSEEACRRLLEEQKELPPFPPVATVLDIDCRHVSLDAMQFSARHRQQTRQGLQALPEEIDESVIDAVCAIDWNTAMTVLNEKYDIAVAGAREPDPVKRQAHAKEYYRTRHTDDPSLLEKLLHAAETEPNGLSQFMGELCFEDCAPAGVLNTELIQLARRIVVRTAYAAHLYRVDYGSYPISAEFVAPALGELPLDPFTGKRLSLKTIDGGVIIYSVGLDRKDDGGHEWKDISHRLHDGDADDSAD